MLKVIFSVAISFLLFLLIHLIHFHYFEPLERVHSLIGAAVIGYLLFYPIYYLLPDEETLYQKLKLPSKLLRKLLPCLLGTLLFCLLLSGYLIFYFTADRSITFRMLILTEESANQKMSEDEMLVNYDTKDIIHRRFDDLVYGGYMKKEDQFYSVTPKGKFILGIYRTTIDFMHMRKF